jgi:predicted AAA+ superfamily ATPase
VSGFLGRFCCHRAHLHDEIQKVPQPYGYLPRICISRKPQRLVHAYVADYLKEEIAAEGLVRNLPAFSDFLNMAALSDSEPLNFSTIARDCGVSRQTIKQYFQILEDTLLGRWFPSYRRRPKRRVKGLRSIINDHPLIKRRIMVCIEDKTRKTDDGIEIMPAIVFVKNLWQGDFF